MTETKHLMIHGLVQGVGFRWSMQDAADRLGIRGWVRNRREGPVEAMIQGDPAAMEEMILWCRKGPVGSRVSDVIVDEGSGEYDRFSIVPSI